VNGELRLCKASRMSNGGGKEAPGYGEFRCLRTSWNVTSVSGLRREDVEVAEVCEVSASSPVPPRCTAIEPALPLVANGPQVAYIATADDV